MAAARRGAKTGSTYHHGALPATLIQAAAEVAAQQGVHAINLRALARAAGVSPGAPFRHFEDRLALLAAVAEDGLGRLQARQLQAVAQLDDPVEQARARGVAYVGFAVAEPGYFRVMHEPEVIARSAPVAAAIEHNRAMMDAVLGVSAGPETQALMRRSAGTLAAQALVYGLARLLVDGLLPPVTPEEAERLTYELTGVLGEGLEPRGPGSPADPPNELPGTDFGG